MSDAKVVLVTGASGYVATHVIKALQEAGYRVRATVRNVQNDKKFKHLCDLCPDAKFKVELVEADLLDPDSWTDVVKGCTYVHHVASPLPAAPPRDESLVIRPALEGTLNVLKACAASGTVKRVVFTSAALTIARAGGNETPFTENDWLDPDTRGITAYTKSKILAEKAAWKFVKELPENNKFEFAVVVPALILGPPLQGTLNASSELIKKMMERDFPAIPKLNCPTVDVRDVALAHLKCMTIDEAVGHRHIVITRNIWFKEIAQILDKEFRSQGYNVPTGDLPSFILWIASWFDKKLSEVRHFDKVMTFDTTRMRTVLGIDPIPLEKSIIDMAYACIERGFIKKTAQYRGRESQN